jgi:hypothetical protein
MKQMTMLSHGTINLGIVRSGDETWEKIKEVINKHGRVADAIHLTSLI